MQYLVGLHSNVRCVIAGGLFLSAEGAGDCVQVQWTAREEVDNSHSVTEEGLSHHVCI